MVPGTRPFCSVKYEIAKAAGFWQDKCRRSPAMEYNAGETRTAKPGARTDMGVSEKKSTFLGVLFKGLLFCLG